MHRRVAMFAVNWDELRWQADAACAEITDEDLRDSFFPDDGKRVQSRRAKAVCAMCLVADECLEYALDNFIRDGIWGGTSLRQREVLWRARRADDERSVA